jgi:hypothetical protein
VKCSDEFLNLRSPNRVVPTLEKNLGTVPEFFPDIGTSA